ncbi:class I SAM-dependent methyltransferase [Bradyrhizobium sp. CB1650]|uniref:class I SAM-dependent methyltransferase n=1 Tax=Bradyrhizobium sp. CB1650 TaxID=3039153 RepID=UPI00243590AD|nr:class I SAM-dependent methyltransferase [Bradyrhizobium sp. CB1650]WGD55363.1 class I SAM-dependent methyltransferase [Bradyrhizobium sp. CB1650]
MLREEDLPTLYSRYYPRRNVDLKAIKREADAVLAAGAEHKRHREGSDNQGQYLVKPGQKVLDIGCGSCVSLIEVRNLGGKAWGIETDPNVGAIADHFGLDVHIGSIHDEPFPGEDFDLIVLNQVIEHVPDPIALLKLVRRRLRPDGKVVLAFPNTASLNKRVTGRRWINWHIPYHLHHYNKRSFTLIAEQAGYGVASMQTITPNVWTILQMQALLRPASEQQAAAWGDSTTATAAEAPVTVKKHLVSIAHAIIGPFNRIMDQMGLGDSLLVKLRPK